MSVADPQDRALVASALSGDEAGYAGLMRRHRDAVYRLARGHVGDADEALDVTQDTFVAAFAALARYDPARPFRFWIARIALNKCRDWARRRAVRRFFTAARPIDEALDVRDDGATPEDTLGTARELARINGAVAALPETLKNPLLLCAIEGMSQSEAAQLLGITPKAIETRLYRARAKLDEMLRD